MRRNGLVKDNFNIKDSKAFIYITKKAEKLTNQVSFQTTTLSNRVFSLRLLIWSY